MLEASVTERQPWEGRVALGQTIRAVRVPRYPVVALTFADGFEAEFDLGWLIASGPAFKVLVDPLLFAKARPGSGGASLEWPISDDEELDLSADALRMEAEGIWDPKTRTWKEQAGTPPRGRDDTTLEAAGAEHLVIGRLLIDHIQTFRAQSNQAGYDLIAVNSDGDKSLRLQVKARTANDAGGFRIKNYNFDFLVLVRLNRGSKVERSSGLSKTISSPQHWILSRDDAMRIFGEKRVRFDKLSNSDDFLEKWSYIWSALNIRNVS